MDNQNYQGPQNNGGNGNNNGNGGNDQKGPQKRQSFMLLLVAALITLLSMSFLMNSVSNSSSKEITYDEFLQMVEDGKVDSVLIKSDKLVITPKQDKAQERRKAAEIRLHFTVDMTVSRRSNIIRVLWRMIPCLHF